MKKIFVQFNKSSEKRDCAVYSMSLELDVWKEIPIKENLDILRRHHESDPNNEEFYLEDDKNDSLIDYIYSLSEYPKVINTVILSGEVIDEHGVPIQIENTNETEKYMLVYDYRNGDYAQNIDDFRMYHIETEIVSMIDPNTAKRYCEGIDGKIEFIVKSSLDDVLLREWICDWNVKTDKKTIYPILSSKLKKNWTFKIEQK